MVWLKKECQYIVPTLTSQEFLTPTRVTHVSDTIKVVSKSYHHYTAVAAAAVKPRHRTRSLMYYLLLLLLLLLLAVVCA